MTSIHGNIYRNITVPVDSPKSTNLAVSIAWRNANLRSYHQNDCLLSTSAIDTYACYIDLGPASPIELAIYGL